MSYHTGYITDPRKPSGEGLEHLRMPSASGWGGDVKSTLKQREVVDFNRKSIRVLKTREHNRRSKYEQKE